MQNGEPEIETDASSLSVKAEATAAETASRLHCVAVSKDGKTKDSFVSAFATKLETSLLLTSRYLAPDLQDQSSL